MTNDEIIDRALVSGASRDAGGYGDVVYLAEISNKVARMNQSSGESLLRETRSLVQRILGEQLMLVGDASSTGFTPWTGTHEEQLARIEQEWRVLGRDPNIGDVCWFENTATGNARAKQSPFLRWPDDKMKESG